MKNTGARDTDLPPPMLTSNCMCRPYIDTNNPQDMQLGRFKNRTPARFEYIYCTLFPLCHGRSPGLNKVRQRG